MVNPQFNVKHRLIIKRICEAQEKNLKKIERTDNIKEQIEMLQKEGYDISLTEYLLSLAEEKERYKNLKKDPNQMFYLLGDRDLSVFKTELLNRFSHKKDYVRQLWRKVFISETIVSTQLN